MWWSRSRFIISGVIDGMRPMDSSLALIWEQRGHPMSHGRAPFLMSRICLRLWAGQQVSILMAFPHCAEGRLMLKVHSG